MLTDKQIRMGQLLDKQVANCAKCDLVSNGKCVPFWTPKSKYAIIGQAPSYREIKKRIPFSGSSGEILTSVLGEKGFKASEFLIINSVQCKPDVRSYGKPTLDQLNGCQDFIRKYLKVIRPEKILCLGNYGKHIFTNNIIGVMRQRGSFVEYDLGHDVILPVLCTISPSYCIHNREEGLVMLKEDIALFKNTHFQRVSDWLLSEEDFLV